MSDDPFINELERAGYKAVRAKITVGGYAGSRLRKAEAWVKARAEEMRGADQVASLKVAASTRDSQWDAAQSARIAADEARSANTLAREANASASDANVIAREASDSAKRSASAARISNIIAAAALLAAMIAIVVSIMGLHHQ